ncbi:uncharacterized protein SCHCODRAFT_02532583 [Schizophyllum commune H4-8]|uniref:uncharacterized protein n=1 Tax=Schizophyllum commune (strain H4-8 / FGSC 9210) TaxID=578458 RepID=UPI00215EF85A|nr:uncharacterized protein SCHCODRAFT_02532583 [Schizophyllum commune H4-8]KAI5896530.1 hypothetical protein SCHCODRAFT_02532583 [Schizophyllum commune H4-8]
MSYYSYGSPTAPYYPALAQDLRMTENQQEYYQPNPPFNAYSAQPGSSYIGPYDRTSHAASYGSQFREQTNSLSHSSTRWQQAPYQTTYPASQDVRTWGPPYSRSSVYTGYTSPVRASVTRINELPPELLSHIFLETLPVQLCDARPHNRAAPLILSHVCRYWRDIAISLPSLWQRLCLTGCQSRRNHRRLRLAQTYMDRVRGTGLVVNYSDVEASDVIFRHWDVVVCGQGLTFAPAADRCYCALDLLISRISEVRVLELIIGQASTLRLSSVPPAAAAALRNLVVRFLEGGETTQMLSRLYTDSPSITQFTWANFHDVCLPRPPIAVPWSQLTSAHIDDCVLTHSAFLSIMENGQRLSDVRVRLGRDNSPPPHGRAQVRQAKVATLTIYGNEPLDVVLSNLQLPSLRTLSLRSDTNDITVWPCADTRTLQQFIAHVSPALDSFKVSRAENVTEQDLVVLLELPQMSTLKSLSVYGPCVRDEFFARLHPGHGAPLAPHLTMLAIGRCTTTDGIIADMIQSRRTYGYPLQHADITFNRDQRDLHARDTAEFRDLEKCGMFVRGSYSTYA